MVISSESDTKVKLTQFQVFLGNLRKGMIKYEVPEGYETHAEYEKALHEFITGEEEPTLNNQQWKPAFGGEYFKEKKHYNTKVKDIPNWDPRTAVPEHKVITQPRFVSPEEIKSIFAEPLTGDHRLTEKEIEEVNSFKRHGLAVMHFTEANPCVAHLKNMLLDRCQTRGSYEQPGNWERWMQCARHQYKYTLCVVRNEDWMFARLKDLKERTNYEHVTVGNRYYSDVVDNEVQL